MPSLAQIIFAASVVVFLFFFANVAAGAFFDAAWMSAVAEWVVLVLASVLFVAATLLFEKEESGD